MKKGKSKPQKQVEAVRHDEASRKNIPTAEYESMVAEAEREIATVTYPRGVSGLEEEKASRNRDLDPQLVWRGKDEKDWSDLVVPAPPLYIQEKVQPKVLIDDLLRSSRERAHDAGELTPDLFADFNGLPTGVDKTEFYQHDQNWSNRMILGDSLQVMASLAEREGLRGKVQCIYFDPPYGIKFNSNFQWSTTSRDVKDGNAGHITREPEQVKAFRDTWRDGIHSYLAYLRDRFTVARDLLGACGSIFVQIGDENVHRVRALMDEVFGDSNFCAAIAFLKTSAVSSPMARTNVIGDLFDYILWFAKDLSQVKFRQPYQDKVAGESLEYRRLELQSGERFALSATSDQSLHDYIESGARVYRQDNIISTGFSATLSLPFSAFGREFSPGSTSHWKTTLQGMQRLLRAGRLEERGKQLAYVRFIDDFRVSPVGNYWDDVLMSSRSEEKTYVVQTSAKVAERCVLMASDPGDLVLDPTCGAGTTAFVSEQWGRRWITIDTSRVALALARARIMGARYPFYLLADSREGQLKEAEVTRTAPSSQPVQGNIRHGFVCERVPHITLKSIANNAEIDVIWENWQQTLESLRMKLNAAVKRSWQEWEVPREPDAPWPETAKKLHTDWWQARIARKQEIDKSIASKAEVEYLWDKPYDVPRVVRVAGPFTVESLSPHRILGVGEDDELVGDLARTKLGYDSGRDFATMILDNLKAAGIQQAHKEDRISFSSLVPWPGELISAEGRYREGIDGKGQERRAAVFIGPEFGTVSRPDLVAAAREAADAGFDALIACAFNFEAHSTEFAKLGRIPVLKARMNADLHMAADLKATGKGNLFVIFGEPDIEILDPMKEKIRVRVRGVDVFHPQTGEVRSDGADGIACWFIDTDYNEESFFVRQAYFLGATDPYKALKTTLKAEIDEEAWSTLHSDISRPFAKPTSGRLAVKVINHLGDEVMKVFRV